MAWRRPGDKSLSEPMLIVSLTHIWVSRLQWVKFVLISVTHLWLSQIIFDGLKRRPKPRIGSCITQTTRSAETVFLWLLIVIWDIVVSMVQTTSFVHEHYCNQRNIFLFNPGHPDLRFLQSEHRQWETLQRIPLMCSLFQYNDVIGSVSGLWTDGTKPQPQLIWTYHQWSFAEFISWWVCHDYISLWTIDLKF